MASPIAHVDGLKSLADSFLDTVSFYLATFLPYHTAFKTAAAGILIPLGILWIGIQVFKMPANKGASALGGFLILAFCAFLLGTKTNPSSMFNGNPPPANTTVAEGSYWSFVIPAELYKLFKSALLSVENSSSGKNAAMELAYNMNTKKVASKWDGSGLQDAYIQYVTECTGATMSDATTDDKRSSLGHVGLHSGSGIGYTAADRESLAAGIEQFTATSDGLTSGDTSFLVRAVINANIPGTPISVKNAIALPDAVRAAWKADDIDDGIEDGKAILKAIPENGNPFKDVATKFPSGFKIETQDAWKRRLKIPGASNTGHEYFDGSAQDGGKFKNPAVISAGTSPNTVNPGFYPENCLEAFEMVNLGVAAYRQAILSAPEYKNASKSYAAAGPITELAELMTSHRLRAEAKLSGNEYTKANSAALSESEDIAGRANNAAVSIYGLTQSAGAKISEWLLQVKMPFFISTISMMCAGLITAFPIFVIISIFLGHGILISYIKLVAFCFLVILLNEIFLSMGATLIAISKQMDLVYRIGNIARNNSGLELASATAEVVIFTSLMVIEAIIAKMLIWDDVKGMTGFNPGEGGAAATRLGVQAMKIAGSIAALPLGAKMKMASMTAKTSATAAHTSTTMLNQKLMQVMAQNGGNVGSGIRTLAKAQSRSSEKGNSGGATSNSSAAPSVGLKRGTQPRGDDGGQNLVPKE